jgi:hypothetical protein
MEGIEEKTFIEVIRQLGITVDTRYPDTAELGFGKGSEISRFWEIPKEARRIPYFVETILSALDAWESMYVWKHMGSWFTSIKGERLNDDVQAVIYQGIGIKENNANILKFTRNELTELVTLTFNQLVFGWHVGDDLYIIPDHGRQMIKTDHHDVVHVSVSDKSTMEKFINTMAAKGFELPEDIPDETFKRPGWMK